MQHDFSWSLRAYTHMGQRSEGGPKDPLVEGKTVRNAHLVQNTLVHPEMLLPVLGVQSYI